MPYNNPYDKVCSRCKRNEYTLHSSLGILYLIYPSSNDSPSPDNFKRDICIPHLNEIKKFSGFYPYKFKRSVDGQQLPIAEFIQAKDEPTRFPDIRRDVRKHQLNGEYISY